MKEIIQFFIFMNLIFLSLSIIPIWNFYESSTDLLSNNEQRHEYLVKQITSHFDLKYTFRRIIEKKDGVVTFKNNFTCQFTNDDKNTLVVNQIVNFNDLESAYTDKSGKYYICPKGRNHVLYYTDGQEGMIPIVPDNFEDKGDWELNCYLQYQKNVDAKSAWKKLFVFYLNKEDYIYEINANTRAMSPVNLPKINILSFRWTTESNNNIFPMYAIYAKEKEIYINKIDFTITGSETSLSKDTEQYLGLTIPNSNFKSLLNGDSSKLFYISYEPESLNLNIGYIENMNPISSYSQFHVVNNEISFEFIDKVKLENIELVPYTKYAYYKLYNEDKNKYYYGVINIEQNKIIYNLDEQLTTFIPYLDNSMLAINSESAYQICAIPDTNKKCIDSCSSTIYYDVNSNICTDAHTCSHYTLFPNAICIDSCDTNLYYSDNQALCGLCKDFDIDKPYKMINYEGCLESKIDNSEFINEDLKIITCKNQYSYLRGECLFTDCYANCETCSSKSSNENEQKCLTCKSDFPYLYNTNCIIKCPDKTYIDNMNCIDCDKSCLTCDINGCTSCNQGFYLNNTSKTCETCHPKCETCNSAGNDKNNSCTKCKDINDILINGNCISECGVGEYKDENSCKPCQSSCATCENGYSCLTCLNGYYFNNNQCPSCHENCDSCEKGGDEKNNNCLNCKNNYYLIKGGESENNCVENCPQNTIKDDTNKTCTFIKPIDNKQIDDHSSSSSDLLIWIFVIVAGVLLILINVIFCFRNCCFKPKENNIVNKIETELSETNLVVN